MKLIFVTIIIFISTHAMAFDHSHSLFTKILKEHVVLSKHASQVNYKKLKANPKELMKYLKGISDVSKSDFNKWTADQQKAYLINAYNGFTLQIVVENYPIESIKDIGSLFKKTWKIKFFKLFGKDSHLDYIEHKLLRKNYAEPRVHFAVNCASIGCPRLLNVAYEASKLNSQLDQQTKVFLADITRNRLGKRKNTLYLSKIFDWFEEDFTKNNQTVEKFIAPYITTSEATRNKLHNQKYTIKYLNYNWDLNEIKPAN